MAGKRILAKTAKVGYFRQKNGSSVWDEVGLVNTAFKEVLVNAKVTTPDPTPVISNFDYAGDTGTSIRSDRIYIDGNSELKSINFSGFAYKEAIAMELASIFQDVTEYSSYTVDTTADDTTVSIASSILGLGTGATVTIAGATFHGETSTTIDSIDTLSSTITLRDAPDDTITGGTMTVVDSPKEFTPNDAVIDFASNEGYLYTIAHQMYNGTGVGDGVKLDNALLQSYTLSITREGASGIDKLLKREGTWVGNVMTPSLDFTGTWTTPPASPTYYKDFRLDLVVDGVTYSNLCYKDFSIKFDRTITPICDTSKANNYLTQWSAEATINIPLTDSTYLFLAKYKAGANVSFNFYCIPDGIPNTYHEDNFGITVSSGKLKNNPYGYDGEYGALKLDIAVNRPTAGYAPTVIFADGILGGY